MEAGREKKEVVIAGGGLVGSLLAVCLARRGYKVDVFERRPDPRMEPVVEGRSINLALSTRGRTALQRFGLGHLGEELGVPMFGRIIHSQKKDTAPEFIQYGVDPTQHLLSISRRGLNEAMITEAEKSPQVQFHFGWKCTNVDLKTNTCTFQRDGPHRQEEQGEPEEIQVTTPWIVGADGAFSVVRKAMQRTDCFNFSQNYLTHGYKELSIPPTSPQSGGYRMDSGGLHIWPRGEFMMIALPNLDGSFTLTLFMPLSQFELLRDDEERILAFFEERFPDAVPLIGREHIVQEFLNNPTGSLVTIRCEPWHRSRAMLIGDAAHAIVPFYGQGMNAGFEDVFVLDQLLEQFHEDLDQVLPAFTAARKADADAIADLAQYNYLEMRSHVAHSGFLWRKRVDWLLAKLFPASWIPLYSMVSFTNIPYAQVVQRAQRQDGLVHTLKRGGFLAVAALVAGGGVVAWLARYRPEYLRDLLRRGGNNSARL
ncbi:kynurenine 3-monooxygenase, mitochondrial precursor [Balamuthia mandrillaris]